MPEAPTRCVPRHHRPGLQGVWIHRLEARSRWDHGCLLCVSWRERANEEGSWPNGEPWVVLRYAVQDLWCIKSRRHDTQGSSLPYQLGSCPRGQEDMALPRQAHCQSFARPLPVAAQSIRVAPHPSDMFASSPWAALALPGGQHIVLACVRDRAPSSSKQ